MNGFFAVLIEPFILTLMKFIVKCNFLIDVKHERKAQFFLSEGLNYVMVKGYFFFHVVLLLFYYRKSYAKYVVIFKGCL